MRLIQSGTEEVDHTAVGAAITTIASNLPEMTRGVRMIAALMEDTGSGEKLLEAARQLCHAFSDLLKAAEPEAKEVSIFYFRLPIFINISVSYLLELHSSLNDNFMCMNFFL